MCYPCTYCGKCGAKLPPRSISCPKCNTVIPDGEPRCPQCGWMVPLPPGMPPKTAETDAS